jgi:hypothetical protein
MSRLSDRLKALASHLEEETPTARAEQIAGRAVFRAEHRVVGRLRSFAHRLEAGTRGIVAERIASRAVAVGSGSGRSYVLRRIGAVAAATLTIAAGAVGVGAIANQASPGDLLYGIDRAYEAAGSVFGSHSDHTQERLSEALQLLDQGRSVEAVKLVDEAVSGYTAQHGLTDLEKEYATLRVHQVMATTTTTTTEPEPATSTTPPSATQTTAPQTSTTEDPVTALRLAVEMLLRDVQETGTPTDAVAHSALQAAAAATAVEDQGPVIAAGTTTTTTEGTSVPETTSAEPTDSTTTTSDTGNATTLTMPDGTTSTTTPGDTTTTLPEETSTSSTSAPPSTTTTTLGTSTTTTTYGGGGIILPPQP